MFEPVGIFQCTNGVASEEKIRDYVKKEKIGCSYTTQYGTQREIITLESVDALQRIMKKMYKFCLQQHVSSQQANEGADVIIRRIDAKVETSKIDADVKIQKKRIEVETKQMDVEVEKIKAGVETKRMELLMECKITFEQYMQMNKI